MPKKETTISDNIRSIRPALAELERAVSWLWDEFVPTKPKRQFTITIQSKGKKSKCVGWTLFDGWSTKEGENVDEINICAEDLQRDPIDIIGTMAHELAHLQAKEDGSKDTATNGRHNRIFVTYANGLGMECKAPTDSYGWGYTSLTEYMKERIIKDFEPDYMAFNLFKQVKLREPKENVGNLWVCKCEEKPVKIRRADVDVTCNKCHSVLEKEDGDE